MYGKGVLRRVEVVYLAWRLGTAGLYRSLERGRPRSLGRLVRQVRRGEGLAPDRFHGVSYLSRTPHARWPINIREIAWRVAPGHWHLYADIDTSLRDDREALIDKVRGERREVPLLGVSPSASSD
jgi:hypothetical protein